LIQSKKVIVLGGAHDALSAKLIQETGFDAVWASSFGISASLKCLPDANVLTMTEALESAKGMNEAVSIPVIADCDNGYGNALNVIRMVKEYERAGIAGVSIEDNPFPKKCSLYPGERQELVDRDEMAGRIHAAKSTQASKDFFVIARTEALIAGLGMEEALVRAKAYEEAGADAILIHSRQSTADEIRAFAGLWNGKIPLVAVPTKYPAISASELGTIGIKVVIFANQALRASVRAMRQTLGDIRRDNSARSVDKKIARLDEVFKLVGQPALEEHEARFVKSFKRPPTAVIVAAGFERNLWPLNSDKPKAMLEIKGKTLLERQVDMLRRAGLNRIAVVTGYKREKIRMPHIVTYANPHFKETHILHSLFQAEPELEGKFLFLYGDVIVDGAIVEKLLRSKRDITLVVKRRSAHESFYPHSSKPERDWVIAEESVKAIGHHLDPRRANAEFAGLALFSSRGAKIFRQCYHRILSRNGHAAFHNAPSFRKAQFTDLIQELIDRKEKVGVLEIESGWLEIDTFADYQKAWAEVRT
jgi:phosphoenolpyruvate phosphomutase